MSKNRLTIAIALFLMLTMVVPLVALPTVNAEDFMTTYSYIGATPNPVQVGQPTLLHVGITLQLAETHLGWVGITVTVTKPDGNTETLGPAKTDATGGTGIQYTPEMTGEYTFQSHFPEQENPMTLNRNPYYVPEGTVMEASDSPEITVVVTEEPQQYWPGVPLPSEYWTRPINAQIFEWAAISGSWLTLLGSSEVRYAPYNDDAPEAAHILWTHQLEMGGLVGGEFGAQSFEDGSAYEDKAEPRIIVDGILFFSKFNQRGEPYQSNNEVTAIDLHTGEVLWSKPLIGRVSREGTTTERTVSNDNKVIDGIDDDMFPNGIGRRLSIGQLFYWDSYNFHGVFGMLWTVDGSTWQAFDAINGRWKYTIENVPSGSTIYGPKGEIYRRIQDLDAGWMALWNMSALVSMEGSWRPNGNIYNASGTGREPTRAWTYNITIPTGLPGSIQEVELGNKVFGLAYDNDEVSSWAFSLKPGQEGQLLYSKTVAAPAAWSEGNVTLSYKGVDFEADRFVISCQQTREHWGFSASTGEKVWGPTEPQPYLDFLQTFPSYVVEGRLFSGGMSGVAHCYNVTNGELMWTYEIEDPYAEVTWTTNYPRRYSQGFIADGKYYSGYFEHSPMDPKPRGAPLFCLDATTGEEIWSIFMAATSYRFTGLIGDSIEAVLNTYDNRFYGIGKGPSATTVSIEDDVVTHGDSVLVKGMVTDVSPGTNDPGLTMRFPNGVPAVSDESQSEWMQYVYMQFGRPTNATGVEVTITVLDPNGNCYDVATTTSDASGLFSCEFTPEVPGKYTVLATFEGSKSYYGSFAETAVSVKEAPAATVEPTPTPASMTDTYVLGIGAGAIIAIVAIGLILVLMLRKR